MSTFELTKLKITKSGGLEIGYNEMLAIDKETNVRNQHTVKSSKDEPHPDMKKALANFEEIVRYDEGYSKKEEITITGVTFFPSGETLIITHSKKKKSGSASTNSGRISFESENFEKADRAKELFEALQLEASLYLFDGKRPQLSISFEGSEEKAA